MGAILKPFIKFLELLDVRKLALDEWQGAGRVTVELQSGFSRVTVELQLSSPVGQTNLLADLNSPSDEQSNQANRVRPIEAQSSQIGRRVAPIHG